jgi:serine/threonine protein kinase
MASVYKAHDLASDRTVALKVLTPQLALLPNFKSRFEREARVLKGLRHPNIVPIYAFGEDQGFLYIVMPYMDHGSLTDRLKSGSLTVKEGARIIGHVASALQFAHEAGVVHRDVKPSNILIDKEGNVWLSDFGFAHVRDSTLSLTGSAVIGTPAYMAPEQIRGEGVTTATDLYSLGVVLYQISTGKLPYDAEMPIAIAVKHASEPLPRPRSVNPNLPDRVEAVLVKALAKDPKDRFRSVQAFNDAFQEALIEAVDPSTGRLRPNAITPGPVTVEMDTSAMQKFAPERPPRRWRYALLALLLLLLLTPLTVWALSNLRDQTPAAAAMAAGSATQDLVGTIDALHTQVSGSTGTPLSEQARETTVAGTLTSLKATDAIEDDRVLTKGSPTFTESPLTGTVEVVSFQEDETTPTATSSGSSGSEATDVPASSPPPASSATPGPSPTTVASPTSGPPPTSTHTATLGPSPTPTWTAVQSPTPSRTPTLTTEPPTPTYTLVPTATNTPEPTSPPAPTATENVCAKINLSWKKNQGTTARFTFTNSSGSSVSINSMSLNWPEGNMKLEQAKIGGTTVWSGSDDAPPTSMSGFSKSVGAGSSAEIVFTFKKAAGNSGYNLTVHTSGGCQDSASH